MRRDSFFLALIAVLCALLLVEASPARSKSPSRRPSTPVRRPSTPVRHPTKPVVVTKKPVVVHHPPGSKPVVVHPGGTKPVVVKHPVGTKPIVVHPAPPAHNPAPVHHSIPPPAHSIPPTVHHSIPPPAHSLPASRPSSPAHPIPPAHSGPPSPAHPIPPAHSVPATPPSPAHPIPPPAHGTHPAQPTHSTGPTTGSPPPPHNPPSTSKPAPPQLSELDQLSKCPTYVTCETCAAQGKLRTVKVGAGTKKVSKKVKCGWQQADTETHGRCVTIESTQATHSSLISEPTQCTALYERVADHQRRTHAQTVWAGMQDHVFNGNPAGQGKAEAGRHLASKWMNTFKTDVISWDANTKLGKSPKGKTLWRDTAYDGGVYTQADIQSMCIEAIISSIKEHEGRRTPASQQSHSDDGRPLDPMDGHHAYSVFSPRTHTNLCLEVFSTYSCFPAAIKPSNKAPGSKCAEDSQVFD